MEINRIWAMPSKNTFEIKPVSELIEKYVIQLNANALIVDPFANKTNIGKKYGVKEITNDLDESFDTDYHMDALDFLKTLQDNSVDVMLFDSPFSPRQVSECYKKLGYTVDHKTTQASYWSNLKKEIGRVLKKDGICFTCGWNSGGIGKKYGCEIVEILMVPHGGWHNDTIVVVDKKT